MTATLSDVLVGGTMPITEAVELTNKGLVDNELWTRLVNRIVKDEGVDLTLAERIMDQALGFLQLCAHNPTVGYSPSPLVDIGWHTFILYTAAYAEFCQRVAGGFIHHNPTDEVGVDYGIGGSANTVAAMAAAGIVVDEMLWGVGQADCNDCRPCEVPPIRCRTAVSGEADCNTTCHGTGNCSSGRPGAAVLVTAAG